MPLHADDLPAQYRTTISKSPFFATKKLGVAPLVRNGVMDPAHPSRILGRIHIWISDARGGFPGRD